MKNTLVRRALVGASVCAVTIVGLGAGSASAGEITGSGTIKEVRANSVCAFSGLNDGFIDPQYATSPEDAAVRVQNWGTDKKFLTFLPKGFPGQACNPNAMPPEGPA